MSHPLEIKINDRVATVELIEQKGSLYRAKIDDIDFWFDVENVEKEEYSIIFNHRSTNMEMIEGNANNHYFANTLHNQFEIEILDAQAKYEAMKSDIDDSENIISTPMPGIVVKVSVKEGDIVKKGETVIVVSAMKMESEYKSQVDGKIKKVNVQENETVEANQPLIELEVDNPKES